MYFRRSTATLLLSLFSIFSFAGHESGGVIITYESVASVNNNPLEYVLNVYMFYDKQGPVTTPPTILAVSLNSSCYATTSISLPTVNPGGGFLTLSGADYCTPGTAIQSNIGLAHYQDTILLPGTCGDFRFNIASGFGRFNTTSNLTFNFNTNYFEARLNNNLGPTSSPNIPIGEALRAACLNKPLNLFNMTEADGDSMHYNTAAPLTISGGVSTQMSYGPGFSQSNQTGTTTTFSLNAQTGLVQTQIPSAGNYALTLRYREYRVDTATQNRIEIGRGRFTIIVVGSPSCTPDPFELTQQPSLGTDSVACGTNKVRLATTRRVAPNTITPNGSEFLVSSQQAGSLSVQSATALSDTLIELTLTQTIPHSDVLEITAQKGADSNVVLSICGNELGELADTMRVYSNVPSPVTSGFTANDTLLTVTFSSGGSSPNVLNFIWDFGDGSTTSSMPNLAHTYATPGMYTVQLIVFGECGISDTSTQTIQICDVVTAAFNSSLNGDTASFDATASIGATQYLWDYGDGSSGTGVNSSHIYTQAGKYWVELITINPCGDSSIVGDSLEVCSPPWVFWSYNIISSGTQGMTVDFDGSNAANAASFIWDFGDGNTNSTSLTPTHTYVTVSLTYQVTLTITNACGDVYVHSYRLDQVGLDEESILFSLYPNPTHGQFHVKAPGEAQVQVYDCHGRLVINQEHHSESTIDLENSPSGVYIVRLVKDGSIHTEKILVSP